MVFSLDIGGTYIKYANINNGKIVNKGKWNTAVSLSEFLDNIENVILAPVERIGISCGGFWDTNGKAIGYSTIAYFSEYKLTDLLSQKYGCPVYIENDARCSLLAEKELGALRDCKNAVQFVLGSSLGCAVMLNSDIYCGSTKQAGAMFMMPEFYDGNTYRFDQDANSISLTREYDPSSESGNMLLLEEKAAAHDPRAAVLIEKYAKAVALKCWYAYLMYDPECILFGGGISNSKSVTGKIEHELNMFFDMDKTGRMPKILFNHFGEDSNLLGAALLGTV